MLTRWSLRSCRPETGGQMTSTQQRKKVIMRSPIDGEGYVIEHMGYGTALMGVVLLLVSGIVLFYGLDRASPTGVVAVTLTR